MVCKQIIIIDNLKKCDFKKVTCNAMLKISIVMIIIKHLQMNKISALNNPQGINILLNKYAKPNQTKYFIDIDTDLHLVVMLLWDWGDTIWHRSHKCS